ncbi:MATE family efflux transporter [Alteromonadaceae bacterium M269]|nr:MATE family efflux transporter [Alteromonadaceae bacterium M269]
MTIKTEFPKLVKLAWPLLIAQLTQTMMGVSDTIMAGRVSATDMAAVAIASSIFLPVLFFIQGIILALPPIISRLQGSKQNSDIANATQQTMWLALFITVPLSFVALAIPTLFEFAPIEPDLKHITTKYLSYVLWSLPAFALYQVLRNYCEGLSVTKPSMIIMVIGLCVNIPANYIFIHGLLGAPKLDGAGCAVATALVFVAMFISTAIYTLRSQKLSVYNLYQRLYTPNLKDIIEVIKLGFPIAMTILFEVSLFAAIAIFLSPFGATVVASHQIALNFSSLMFMVPLSIGMATTIRVGYLLGENGPEKAKTAIKSAMILGLSCSLITATLSVLLRFPIANLYTTDDVVIQGAASLMLLAAMFQLSDAIQVIAACALRGYKDTKAMFYITFLSYWVIGLTLGISLGLTDFIVPKMAAEGFWIGIIVGLSAAAIMLGLRVVYIQKKFVTQMPLNAEYLNE